MARIQKAICDECGREIPTSETIFCSGFELRVGGEGILTYMHNEDYCSIECMSIVIDKVLKKTHTKLNELKKKKAIKE